MVEPKKLLIVDAGAEFPMAVQKILQDAYRIEVCHEGGEALRGLESFRPDAMILDPLLPGMDGITLLRKAQESYIPPTVLVVTRIAGTYILDALEQLDVSYVMMKPCEPAAVADRLAELMQKNEAMSVSLPNRLDLQSRVDHLLRKLSFPIHSSGYQCLRAALMEEIRNPGQQVTKTLYPAVAKICGGSTMQVEQAIRRQIRQAWRYRTEEAWEELLPGRVAAQATCPTNKEFIAAAAACILTDFQEKDTYLRRIG